MRLTTTLTACALSLATIDTAAADVCGTTPPSEMKVADSWLGVYALINQGKRAAATPEEATKDLCSAKDADRPCDPSAPISVISDHSESTVALAFKNRNGSYAVLTLPVSLPPHAHSLTLKTLANDMVHVNVNWEELGREMFCEPEELDKDGNCVDGRTATVSLGHTYADVLVNPFARNVRWTAACEHGEEAAQRKTRVIRMLDGALGYVDCKPTSDPQWFKFVAGKCAAMPPPLDLTKMLGEARAAAKTGDIKAAVSRLNTILQYAPGRSDYLSERGYLRHKAGDQDGALADLEAARLTNPETRLRSVIYFNLGLVKMAKGDAQGALHAFTHANRLRPTKAAAGKMAEAQAALGSK